MKSSPCASDRTNDTSQNFTAQTYSHICVLNIALTLTCLGNHKKFLAKVNLGEAEQQSDYQQVEEGGLGSGPSTCSASHSFPRNSFDMTLGVMANVISVTTGEGKQKREGGREDQELFFKILLVTQSLCWILETQM
jgi:hypothetical protein